MHNCRCKYFRLHELLSPNTYKDEDTGWSIFNYKLLITIDVIRDIIGYPLYCNTWVNGGNRQYSGYREPECNVGVRNSQHKLGNAVDLICNEMNAEAMRKKIESNKDRLPYNIRIEKDVNWLHIDMVDTGKKIYYFKG